MFPYIYEDQCKIYMSLVNTTPEYFHVMSMSGIIMPLYKTPQLFRVVKYIGRIRILWQNIMYLHISSQQTYTTMDIWSTAKYIQIVTVFIILRIHAITVVNGQENIFTEL